MLKKVITIVFSIIIFGILNCNDYCKVFNVKEIKGLVGNSSVVAWITRCGATGHNTISVTWQEKGLNLEKKRGEIFEAFNGDKIKIEKVSVDTVKIYYFAWEITKQLKQDRGITFIYEAKKLEFFENN